MARALIVFATRSGETKQLAEQIAEGLRSAGHEVVLTNVNDVRKEEDFGGYDAFVFGSATYHGEMLQGMKTMLFLAEKADLKGKVGGAFGAFGWSGEAPDRIFNTMKNIFQMNMVEGALRLKSVYAQGAKQAAQDYGRAIASKLR